MVFIHLRRNSVRVRSIQVFKEKVHSIKNQRFYNNLTQNAQNGTKSNLICYGRKGQNHLLIFLERECW